jgi:predicted ATP-dependent endonuclease of OLD family
MKISKITIDNYKSIKHLEFEPSDGLNAFIGANSSGKSNIFDLIERNIRQYQYGEQVPHLIWPSKL